jgi:hypothetical protein
MENECGSDSRKQVMVVENFEPIEEDDRDLDLAQEIEEYPELKASLQRYLAIHP